MTSSAHPTLNATPTNPFVGARVELRAVRLADYDRLYEAETSHGLLARWRHRGRTVAPHEFASSLWSGVLAQMIVVSVDRGDLLGLVAVYDHDAVNRIASFAFVRFDEDNSVAFLEGAALFVDYVFDHWDLRKLYGWVLEPNFSQFGSGQGRLFEVEGRLRERVYLDGRYVDEIIVSVTRERWVERGRRFAELARANGH